jgi:Fic family protein
MADEKPKLVSAEEILKIDATYEPFPSFQEWKALKYNEEKWARYTEKLKAAQEKPELLEWAAKIVRRAAAIETGAVEGLYPIEHGFTFAIARETTDWQARLETKGENAKNLIEAQLSSYELVLDFATQSVPIKQAWIRELHAHICAGQTTYDVQTPLGKQEQELPKGQYKKHPNHVKTRSGRIFAYAPVEQTASEMQRLCEELGSEEFANSHPILQAAYAHYAFILVHPFADGNGRVARALASVFLFRDASVPLMILADQKDEYLSALEAADRGVRQRFVNFIESKVHDTILMVLDSIRTRLNPTPIDQFAEIQKLFVSEGGFTAREIDRAAKELGQLLVTEFHRQLEEASSGQVLLAEAKLDGRQSLNQIPETHRYAHDGHLSIGIQSTVPAPTAVNLDFQILVPKDTGWKEDIILVCNQSSEQFEIPIGQLIPQPGASIRVRIEMIMGSELGRVMENLKLQIASVLTRRAESERGGGDKAQPQGKRPRR